MSEIIAGTISSHLQDSLIHLCITDDNFIKLVVNQVPSEFFSGDHVQKTYDIICNYYKEHKSAPKNHFHDELSFYSKSIEKDLLQVIVKYITYLKDSFKIVPDTNYILSKLNNFIREKTYIKATYLFAELVERNKFDEAQQLMQKTLKCGISSQQLGSNYFKDDIDRGDAPERLFKIGMPEIDKYVRIGRTDLIAIAGTYKGGKSWFAHHLGFMAIKAGLTVVHVSHENSLNDTVIRYDMMIGGLVSDSKEPREVEIAYLDSNNNRKTSYKIRDSVYNKVLVKKNREKFEKLTNGKLFIQKYPMGTCTTGKLDTFLEQIENLENVKVDVCITDYADIMLPQNPTRQPRDIINDTYMSLKSIADDRSIVMITPSQINDEGAKSLMLRGKLEGRHLSEDRRKFGTIDIGLFVGTNDEYESFNEYIVGCFANRNSVTGGLCVIGRLLDIGQFVMYSYPMRRKSE